VITLSFSLVSVAHWSTSRWPFLAAHAHINSPQGQPFVAHSLLKNCLLFGLSGAGGGGDVPPGGAHKAAGNKAVDMAEHMAHKLRHQFLHPSIVMAIFFSSCWMWGYGLFFVALGLLYL
jgi:hypothetical protein